MSWNGATDVATWELWAGPRADALTRVKGQPRAGFETAISAVAAGRFVQAAGARHRRRSAGIQRDDPDRFVRALTPEFPPAIFLTISPQR